MILVIGGYAQGKLEYVKSKYSVSDEDIYDFEKLNDLRDIDNTSRNDNYNENDCRFMEWLESKSDRCIVFNNINKLIEREYYTGNSPEILIETIISNYPNAIIITDEVGNGIVPVDKNERLLREKIGRIQCVLAEKADEVKRVVCGIGQKIK